MSKTYSVNVDCPECGYWAKQRLWSSVNVTVDPHLKLQLLERKLATIECPQCKATFSVVYPLLYHDMRKKFMVWLRPEGDEPQGPDATDILDESGEHFRFRIVATLDELIEKILIAEDSLDDRVIEVIKLGLWRKQLDDGTLPHWLFYSGVLHAPGREKQIEFTAFYENGDGNLWSLPFNKYAYLEIRLDRMWERIAAPSKWLRVNRHYAEDLQETLS